MLGLMRQPQCGNKKAFRFPERLSVQRFQNFVSRNLDSYSPFLKMLNRARAWFLCLRTAQPSIKAMRAPAIKY